MSAFLHCFIIPCYGAGRTIAFPVKKLRHGWNAVFPSKVPSIDNTDKLWGYMLSNHRKALESLSRCAFDQIGVMKYGFQQSFILFDSLDGAFPGLQNQAGRHALLILPDDSESLKQLQSLARLIRHQQNLVQNYLDQAIQTKTDHRIYLLTVDEARWLNGGVLPKSVRCFLKYGA